MEQPKQSPHQEQLNPSIKKSFANPKLPLLVALIAIVLTVGGILLLESFRKETLAPRPQIQDTTPLQVIKNFATQEECEKESGKRCFLFQGLCQVMEAQSQSEQEANEKFLRECTKKIGTWQPIEEDMKDDTPIDSTEFTAGWQTYRNDEFGFEVKYPREWAFRLVSQTFVSPAHSSFAIQNMNNESQWINILVGKEISEISPHDPIGKMTIDDIPARQFSVQVIPPNIGTPPPGTKLSFPVHPGLWTEKDGVFFAFVFYGTEEIGGIYGQILSTFRFAPTTN